MSKKLNTEKIKSFFLNFNTHSCNTIILGSIIVWILSCSQKFSVFIAEYKNTIAILLVIFYLGLLFYSIYNKKEAKTIFNLVLFGGFLIRAYYVLAAPYGITKHDTGSFLGFDTNETGDGHFGYIEYILKNHSLPDFDPRMRWSFYQPPGFYITAAIILKITKGFNVEAPLCYESIQVITLLFSCLTVWTCFRILEEFDIPDKWMLILVALMSVHPFYSIMSVTLTNDCMAMYFMMLSIWYTIRWYKSPELKNILVIAIAVGTAMFTKLNSAVIVFGIGFIFLYVLWKNAKEWKQFAVQFVSFLAICAPIGLFYPVRNFVKFDMPLTWIQRLSETDPQHIQYSTVFSRLGIPSFKQMSYAFISYDTTLEQNIWIQALRTALFDELMPDVGNSLFGSSSLILLWTSILIAALMNVAFIWSIYKNSGMQLGMRIFFGVEYVSMLASYAKFCLDEPYICTMNYRYIPISMLLPVIGTAIWLKNHTDEKISDSDKCFKNILLCGNFCFIFMAIIINLDLISWSGILL